MPTIMRTPADRRAARLRRLHALTSLTEPSPGEFVDEVVETGVADVDSPYVAFGNVPVRNILQAGFEVPLMLAALGVPRGGRVLELGCGRGIALPVLAERLRPTRLTGLELDAALVSEAERHVHGIAQVEVRQGDACEMPFNENAFDLVIDFGTSYHVHGGAEGSRRVLAEVARVLRPGGLFVHETRAAQCLAHPVRSLGRRLPWSEVPALRPARSAAVWAARERAS